MRTEGLRGVLNRLLPEGLTDGQLLGRFIDGREEAAFAALVRRHGPMVLGVCRRVLGNAHDAEDAFQATFLVLARKAASVARREAVGAFLYGVAYRTALRAREKAARRRAVEAQVEEMPHPEVPPAEAQDWRPVLDRELNALPAKYRAVLLLCDLEGKTRREAARQLGVPEGTVASRLATARRMLARRLARCGVVLSAGALAVALAGAAPAAMPARLVATTAKAAALVAAGRAAAVGAPAVALMNEVLRSMLMNKLKTYAGVVLAAVLLGAGGIAYRAAAQTQAVPAYGSAAQASTGEARPLTELEVLRREVDILKMQMALVQEQQRAQEAELRALKGRAGGAGAAPARTRPAGRGSTAPPGPYQQGPNGLTVPAPNYDAPPAKGPPGSSHTGAGAAPELNPLGAREEPPAAAPPVPQTRPEPVPEAGRASEPPQTTATPSPSPAAKPASALPDTPASGASLPPLPPPADIVADPAGAPSPLPAAAPGAAPRAPDQELEAAVRAFREAHDDSARRRAVDRMEKALQELRQQTPPASRPEGP